MKKSLFPLLIFVNFLILAASALAQAPKTTPPKKTTTTTTTTVTPKPTWPRADQQDRAFRASDKAPVKKTKLSPAQDTLPKLVDVKKQTPTTRSKKTTPQKDDGSLISPIINGQDKKAQKGG